MDKTINLDNIKVNYQVPENETVEETFSKNSETEYGEPQIWIPLSDGTSLEITHEKNGLKSSMQYLTMRYHCSEDDFDEETYGDNMGIIASFMYANNTQLIDGLSIFLTNKAKQNVRTM